MKLSQLIHFISLVVGVLGALALFGAWTAGENGAFLRLSQGHLFNDAIVLELIAVAASVCTLAPMQLEKDNPGSSPILKLPAMPRCVGWASDCTARNCDDDGDHFITQRAGFSTV